ICSREETKETIKRIRQALNSNKIFTMERKINYNNIEKFYEIRITAMSDDLVLANIRDISDLKMTNRELNKIIDQAMQIHEQFLPHYLPRREDYDLNVYYQPAERVGGDLYNIVTRDDQLLFYITDVTGHSLGGTLLNIFARETIHHLVFNSKEVLSPCRIIKSLHDRYCQENFSNEYFIALIVGILDTSSGQINMCNAGIQIPPMIIKNTKEIISLTEAGPPVSAAIDSHYLEGIRGESFTLEQEDILVLSTDGLIEEKRGRKRFGLERYTGLLRQNNNSSTQIINSLKREFKNFMGNHTGTDDITVMAIERK
ncbi:MAG: PP2C family protein-serine/threonine phosphatase, partial [Halanaerobiales bacterium]